MASVSALVKKNLKISENLLVNTFDVLQSQHVLNLYV